MGILDAMVVAVQPRKWYRLDTRPPHYGNEISHSDGHEILQNSSIFPKLVTQYGQRQASQYRGIFLSGGSDVSKEKREFAFNKVFSMGVGNFHYYESWIDDYGGEIQPMHQSGAFNLPINLSLYSIFNGPIWDGDGTIDGTCNFYILVKLDNKSNANPYGILWCDEQTYFTKRWRLLDPRDNEPWKIDIPHDINLSLTAALRRDKESGLLNQQYNFDYEIYFNSDPFQQGWINENSRMAAARQIILVTGKKGNDPKLFSINFSYGSIDRQWRSRSYPKNASVRSGIYPQHEQTNIYPETLHIREDMTISIRGYNKSILGRWFQRYLPCTRQHPEKKYTHPWRFLSEKAFQRANTFSHFGVYDQVDSRNQYYVVEILDLPSSFKFPAILQDKLKQLFIKGIKFNWGLFKDINGLTDFLKDDTRDAQNKHLPQHIRDGSELEALSEKLLFKWNGSVSDDQFRKSRTSEHNEFAAFKLLDRGPLGYILVWNDKRDDDLISLGDLPKKVSMAYKGHNDITLRIVRNIRTTSLPNISNVSLSFLTNNKKLKVLIETEQNEIDATSNLWALRIAALPEGGSPDRVMIYETENLFKHADFKINYNANSNWLTLEGEVEINESYSQYLSDEGALKHATSVWFEDIVGHVSTPDLIKFS